MGEYTAQDRLEATVRDYVRAGWTVMSRTPSSVALDYGEKRARIYLDSQETVQVDGPPLPLLVLTGRAKAWLVLLLILIVVYGVAWAVGWLR